MKRNISIRVICLIIATVILSGAVAYAAVLGSPYETLKNAVFDAAALTNATAETNITISVGGETLSIDNTYTQFNETSSLYNNYDENGETTGYVFSAEDSISLYPSIITNDGSQWYSVSRTQGYYSSYGYSRSILGGLGVRDRDSAQMRFYELLLDALVGDLKNNISMTADNGVRTIRGTLTENQVPELARAGLDMLVEQTGRYYFMRDISFDGSEYIYENNFISAGTKRVETYKQMVRLLTPEENQEMIDGTFYSSMGPNFHGFTLIDGINYLSIGERIVLDEYSVPATRSDFENVNNIMEIPMTSATLNYVHGEAEVDSNGNLSYINVSATIAVINIFGDAYDIDIEGCLLFTDIGSTNPECPIPGALQTFTRDFFIDSFGNEYVSVYFKQNPDGSIDMSSITTTYPGELDRVTVVDHDTHTITVIN